MKILICDDHKIVRHGLNQILQQLDGVTLIKEAKEGDEVLNILKNEEFDILLLDISLPGISGLETLRKVKEKWPMLRVLMLSMYTQEQYTKRAFAYGASGYLTKDSAPEELIMAIKKIMAGKKYIDRTIAENIAVHQDNESTGIDHGKLSYREMEILLKLAAGMSLHEIGSELSISFKTVSTYKTRIFQKMNFDSNNDLIRYCIDNHLA
jgi:DNA-binding NarL/FixJ family response regulator